MLLPCLSQIKLLNCIKSVILKTVIALSAIMKTKLCTILCFTVLIQVSFWEAFELYFLQVTNRQISLNPRDVLLGVISSKCPLLNYLIIIGKLFLWDCRRKGVLPNITNFLAKVNIKLQTEKYISIKNNRLQEFYDKWNFIHSN